MKKLLLSLGTVAAIVAPVASVIACGTTKAASTNSGKATFENSDYGKVAANLKIDGDPTNYASKDTIDYAALKKELASLKLVGQTNEITSAQFLALGPNVLGTNQAEIKAVTDKLDAREATAGLQNQYYFKKTSGIETPILDSLQNHQSPEVAASSLTEDDSVKIIAGTEESIQTADFYLAGENAKLDKGQIGAFQRINQGVPKNGKPSITIESIIDWEQAAKPTLGTATGTQAVSTTQTSTLKAFPATATFAGDKTPSELETAFGIKLIGLKSKDGSDTIATGDTLTNVKLSTNVLTFTSIGDFEVTISLAA